MDIEKELEHFINEQRMEYPNLTDWDVFNLKLGYARGCQDRIKSEMAETMKRLEAVK